MAKRPLIVAGAALIAGYQLLPPGLWWEAAGQFTVGVLATVAVLAAVPRIPRGERWPWVCFALGTFSHAAGHLGFAYSLTTYGTSGLSLWWLLFYPFVAVGAFAVIRRQRHRGNVGVLIDSLMVGTGMALFSWVAVIVPAAADTSMTTAQQVVLMAYPLGDLVLITLMTHLLRGSATTAVTHRWLAGALALVLATDLCWVGTEFAGYVLSTEPVLYRGVQQLFLVAYLCFAVAARRAGDRTTGATRRAPAAWTAVLLPTAAALIGPAILWVEAADGIVTDGRAIAVGCTVLFLLGGWRIAAAMRQLARTADRLREMARLDALTGLPNRRAWNDEFPRRLQHAQRTGAVVTVGVIDLDHFKAYNDTRGHQAGDELLTEAAQQWRQRLRAGDLLARLGGEEFVVLLEDADGPGAAGVLDRLQTATPDGQSFSAGVATWNGSETPHDLLVRADRAMYEAKAAGRRRVTVAAEQREPVVHTPVG